MQKTAQVVEGYRLSPQQKQVWLIQQDSHAYNVRCAILIEGELEPERVESALKKIVQKHEILRTTLGQAPGFETPVQVILKNIPLLYRKVDLRGERSEDDETVLTRIFREEARHFDPNHGPLARFCLGQLSESKQVLLVSLSSLCADSQTLRNLFKEIIRYYAAELEGKELSEEALPYLQFSEWQNELLDEQESEKIAGRVRHTVPELTLPLEFNPAGTAESAPRRFSPEFCALTLDLQMTERIEAISNLYNSSTSGFLLACWQILLWRHTGEREIITECLFDGRSFDELHDSLGLFAGYAPAQATLSRGLRFDEVIKRTMKALQQASASQDLLLHEVTDGEIIDRTKRIGFEYEEWPETEYAGAVKFSYWKRYCCIDHFKLKLGGCRKADGLTIEIQYDPARFSREGIELIGNRYLRLVESVVERQQALISDLEIFGRKELEKLLIEWNRTEKRTPAIERIHEIVAMQAEQTPDMPALFDDRLWVSYRELNRRANQIGHYLQRLGVGPETVVGVCLGRSVEMIVAILGVLKAGGAYLPLDPESPLERSAFMLEDAGVGMVLTELVSENRLPVFWGQSICLDQEWESIDKESECEPESGVESENTAYLIYTSGSTGQPKGVMIRHRSLVNYTVDICRQLRLAEVEGGRLRFATVSSITADLGNTCIYPALVSGGCLHILSYEIATDGSRYEDFLRREPIDVLKIAPSHMGALLESQSNEAKMLPSRFLILGGEALSYALAEQIKERGEGCEVINHYGPTETTIGSLTAKVKEDTRRSGGSAPIGQPISNTECYVLDRELKPTPVGVKGELYLGGEGVARGYRSRPELTAERFIPNLFGRKAGERLYQTGDIVRYLPDGKIEFVGRADNQVKVRGYRVELGEIETALRSHPGVKDAVVVQRDDGSGQKRLVGYVVGKRQKVINGKSRPINDSLEEITPQELKRFVREKLPDYMAPAVIVTVEKLPLTRNGKPDRAALPAPEEIERHAEAVEGEKWNAYEELVGGIWKEVLKVDRVRPGDNFFELGGHSLIATQMISRVRATFGIEIGVVSVFEEPTVRGLAVRIEDALKRGVKDQAPPLLRVERGEKAPLSFAQERLWFLDQLIPNNPLYNISRVVRLEGRLDLVALERVINEVVRRHEALRTRFDIEAGEPVQIIDPWEPRPLEVKDLMGLTREEKEQVIGRVTGEDVRTGFDLSRGPLLRVKVLKLEEDEHILFCAMHHIVSDGWSTGIMIREVGALYQAFIAGEPSPLDELPIQYADFAVWQREYLQGEALRQELEYWREQLDGVEDLQLPTDHPRPAMPTYRGENRYFVAEQDLAGNLRALSQREGVTLFMTLMAVFKLILMRYSGVEDVTVGTVIANRTRKEVEGLIGFFVNTLVMRTDLSGNPNFRELLKRERRVALEAYARQEMPFEKLVEKINPQRDLSGSPIFQVMMVFQSAGQATLELKGVRLSGVNTELAVSGEDTAKFDLTFTITDLGQELTVTVNYSKDLFEAGTIERLIGHYANLLDAVVKENEWPISELSLLGDIEKRQIIEEWNATESYNPKERLIHELFEEQVERRPHAIALVYEEQSLSYGELNRRVNRLAHHLRGLGVGTEARVAICLERGLEMVMALLATLKAGGAYVPLDPDYPAGRLAYMLEDSAPMVLLASGAVKDRLAGSLRGSKIVDFVAVDTKSAEADEGNPDRMDLGIGALNLTYIIYTSGSTGAPKGVMVAHGNVVRLLEATERWFAFGQDDVWTLFHSYAFDFSVWELWGALAFGGRLVIVPQAITRSPEEFYGLLCRSGVTVLNQTPSAFRQLMAARSRCSERHSLRFVIFGGEALDMAALKPWYERNEDQSGQLVNMYGITETTVHVTCRPLKAADAQRGGASPIGRRIGDLKSYILDSHRGAAPIGVSGELHIGGAGLARGYLNRPDLTAERFLPDPFKAEIGERIYKTGDVGRWTPEGEIEFLGRNDLQIKIRGFRVELGEIEARLAERPEVEKAVVDVREDGEGGKRLVAYYTGENVGAEALRSHLATALPEYMIPAAYVHLERLPLTPNGKLDRHALPEPESRAYVNRVYEAPQGETEKKLAQIWAEALKVERVGRHDNFFELGGHSLLVITIIERMRREGMGSDVRTIFTAPTLQALAETIKIGEKGEAPTPPNLIPVRCERITPEMLPLITLTQPEIDNIVDRAPGGAPNVQDIYPLSPMQEGILYHHLMNPDGDTYLLLGLMVFETREWLNRFIDALQAVIDRHDILRTAVVWEGLREPAQVVWRNAPLSVEEAPLDAIGDEIGRQLLTHFDPSRYRLDLGQAPLAKMITTQDTTSGRWTGLLLYHHLVDDNTSMRFIMAEVRAYMEGRAERLAAPLPFRNFIAQARMGISREEHEAFFRQMLEDVDEPTIPFGLTNMPRDGAGMEKAWIRLDTGLSDRLREHARKLAVSAASLCHLAWALVLTRVSAPLSRKEDVVFGTVVFGRMQGGEGSSRTVGPFINTLPVRIHVDEEGVERSVRRVHQLLAELIRHEHASLALAQRCSRVEALTPIFSSALNYRHILEEASSSPEAASAWLGIELLLSEERPHHPLVLSVDDFGDGFGLSAQVGAGIDPAGVLRYMRTALERLTEALENEPEKPLREIDILPEAERKQIIEEWNATRKTYLRETAVHELFEAQAEKKPDAIAVEHEELKITYAELNARANQLAWRLRKMGVAADRHVAIYMKRGVDMVVAVMGTLKAGGTYVPLDPESPPERLAFMLEDAGVIVALTQQGLKERLPAFCRQVVCMDVEWEKISEERDVNPESEVREENLAYVIYTSGSTGIPKGVMVAHRGLCNLVEAQKEAFRTGDQSRVLQFASLAFDASVWEIFGALTAGASLYVYERERLMLGDDSMRVLREDLITMVTLPPTVLAILSEEDLSHLQIVVSAGEKCTSEIAERWAAGRRFFNAYGPTEATVCATIGEFESSNEGKPTIGRPIVNTRLYILDREMRPSPAGVSGELYISGTGLARGYLGRAEQTAESFVPNPFSAEGGDRVYRSGDLCGYLPDGRIEFLGRNDSQVKIRGFRIELGEIESRLRLHPAIREAVTILREDSPGDKRLVAYYTVTTEQSLSAEDLRAFLSESLPEYMAPAAYVELKALPLTPNGKVDRRALPIPDTTIVEHNDMYVAPSTPLEEDVARIFREVLRIDNVGIYDNFFSLGGHSLLAMQVINVVNGVYRIKLPRRALFDAPNVNGLVAAIVESQAGQLEDDVLSQMLAEIGEPSNDE